MSKKAQTWNFRIVNPSNFISFLKKFKLVDKSVPLELEGTNLFGKVRTTDKSVIKYVNVDLNEVLEGELPPLRLKIGILEINKLIDVFNRRMERPKGDINDMSEEEQEAMEELNLI